MLYRAKFLGSKFPTNNLRHISTLIKAKDRKHALAKINHWYDTIDMESLSLTQTTLYEEGRCVQCRKEMANWPPDDDDWKPDPEWGHSQASKDSEGQWYCPECEGI